MKKFLVILMILALCLTAATACGKDESLDKAAEYVRSLYVGSDVTPADFDVVGKLKLDGADYTVEWSVDVADGVSVKESATEGFFTVDVNEKTESEISYKLTLTVKNAKGKTAERTLSFKVPAYKVTSYAEYAAAEKDAVVVVRGIITGIFSNTNGSSGNGIYIQDLKGEGGYYVYGLAEGKDPEADLGLKVGMTIEASGTKDTYNGLYEVMNAAVEILDSEIKTVEPMDYTEIYKNAAELNDASLVDKQSVLVTLKGVEITDQKTDNGYYNFKLGDKSTYIRISSSNNCISKDAIEAFKKAHTDNFGFIADVTGIVQLYNGNFYLIPADENALTNFRLPERSDAEKLAMELGTVKVDGVFTENKTITLPLAGSTYADVTYTWTSDSANVVVGANGEVAITVPDAPAKATLTLVAKCGAVSETKTFELSLSKLATAVDVVNAAYALGEGESLPGTYTLSGIVTEINTAYDAKYGNVTVTIVVEDMADKKIECYRLQGEGCDKIAVGDNITVTGVIKNYKGKVEFDAKCTLDSAKTQAEVVDALYALADGAALEGKYTLTGVITKVDTAYDEKYGNVTVTIQVGDKADKPVMCYRLKGEAAATIAVGDTITVFGDLKNYKNTFEFNSGCKIVTVVKAGA